MLLQCCTNNFTLCLVRFIIMRLETRGSRGMFSALQPKGRRFESTSSHCVVTLDKLLTHNCLRGRQWEATSLISSPGGIKTDEPAFGLRTIIIIISNQIMECSTA